MRTKRYPKQQKALTLIFLTLASLIFFYQTSIAQENKLSNDVQVIAPYQPTISDAFKINTLPKVKDTVKVTSSFDYSIEPKAMPTKFELQPIAPATMLGEPLTKLYSTLIKAGYGNYLTPLIEINYNNLRSKTTSWGIDARHHSSSGKIKLENNEKANSAFSENRLKLYGKYLINKSEFSGNVSYNRNSVHHYGYDTKMTP
jgi:hypothetical protein